jgi:hypothetical protein
LQPSTFNFLKMTHLESTLEDLAPRITASLQQRIAELRLIRTGRLVYSVETEVIRLDGGFRLQTRMEDYGLVLNRRYRFIDNVVDENEALIEQEITAAIGADIEDKINELIN